MGRPELSQRNGPLVSRGSILGYGEGLDRTFLRMAPDRSLAISAIRVLSLASDLYLVALGQAAIRRQSTVMTMFHDCSSKLCTACIVK